MKDELQLLMDLKNIIIKFVKENKVDEIFVLKALRALHSVTLTAFDLSEEEIEEYFEDEKKKLLEMKKFLKSIQGKIDEMPLL